MGKQRKLDFIVDKLTNSIENTLSGEKFETKIVLMGKDDVAIIREDGWQFDWKQELRDVTREVYKLTTLQKPSVIQGFLSLSDLQDHIFLHLLESAPSNIGKNKLYDGVAGNLVAFACKTSFERGYDGFVAFIAKTQLIEHYENTLGAKRNWGNRMFLDTQAAHRLVHKYFKEFYETRSK
jgi:hypothetical protein